MITNGEKYFALRRRNTAMQTYNDKVCLVTGAASGIGRALCEQLAAAGARVVATDINRDLLESAMAPQVGQSRSVTTTPLDVTDHEAFRQVIDDTAAREGRLDYIFNNAGIAISGEVRDLTIDHWRRTLDVNLNGVMYGSILAYQIMARQGFGHIVNISSIEGLIPFPLTVPYVTSKFAVMGLSKGLRVEGCDLGVKTSVVCPGFVATAIFESAQMIGIDRERVMELAAKPWERFSVTPEECARIILKGVARNKAIIPVTLMARVMWWLARLRPNMVINKVIRDFRQWRYKVRAEA